MAYNKITGTPVGADVSSPPPICRPSLGFNSPAYFVKLHHCALRITMNR
ncbi:MAG TPA: hypothetical protein VKP04_00290 [Ktedonobacteraceae bacterium]|nr:hypothetical protein [Ktedonobacteraceae bacterium]